MYPKTRRASQIIVGMTEEEKEMITAAADEMTYSASGWCRAVLVREARRPLSEQRRFLSTPVRSVPAPLKDTLSERLASLEARIRPHESRSAFGPWVVRKQEHDRARIVQPGPSMTVMTVVGECTAPKQPHTSAFIAACRQTGEPELSDAFRDARLEIERLRNELSRVTPPTVADRERRHPPSSLSEMPVDWKR